MGLRVLPGLLFPGIALIGLSQLDCVARDPLNRLAQLELKRAPIRRLNDERCST